MATRGRPAREPTAQELKKVKALVAEAAPQRLIAKVLGRSLPNLRKYFAAELGIEKKSGPREAPFKITETMRDDVALLAACSEPRARIAEAIGIGEDDLVEFFAEELERGAARYRLKALRRLDTLAGTGSASAVRQLAAMTAAAVETEKASAPIGKKAAAKAEAEEAVAAGGKFAPRAAPRLAASDGKRIA